MSAPFVEKSSDTHLLADPSPAPRKKVVSASWLRPAVAMLLIGAAYFLARPAAVPLPDIKQFRFARPLKLPSEGTRLARTVHRDYAPNNGWISSVGAAVSLGDLENSGRSDGCIFVDPRSNQVTYIQFLSAGEDFRAQVVGRPLAPPRLENPAADAGPGVASDETWAPMGSVIGDFDADGWMDVLVYYWGRLPVIFRNPRGTGEWKGSSLEAKDVGGDTQWFTNCVCQADVDGDGRPDLIVGNYFPANAQVLNRAHPTGTQEMQESMSRSTNGGRKYILLNQSMPGAFRFAHAPIELVVDDRGSPDVRAEQILNGWTLALAAADLDGDFLPELYVANDFGPDQLLFNQSEPDRVKFRVTLGSTKFDVPRSKILGRDSFKGMGVDFAVMKPDQPNEPPTILVSNISEPWALLESHFAFEATVDGKAMRSQLEQGIAPFRDRSEPLGLSRSGWGWDVKAADFNNDGYPEIVQALGFLQGEVNRWAYLQELATGNDYNLRHLWSWPYFRTYDPNDAVNLGPTNLGDAAKKSGTVPPFRNAKLSGDSHLAFFARPPGNGAFSEIGEKIGFKDKMVSRGIAVGDIDRDGLIDFVLANQWEDSFAYRNRAPNAGNYVGVRVVRPAGDRPAERGVYSAAEFQKQKWTATPVIGARVILENSAGRTLGSATIDGGNGHSGHRAAEAHFGVGQTNPSEFLDLRVQWKLQKVSAGSVRSPIASPNLTEKDGWDRFVRAVHSATPGSDTSNGWWVVVVGEKLDARQP